MSIDNLNINARIFYSEQFDGGREREKERKGSESNHKGYNSALFGVAFLSCQCKLPHFRTLTWINSSISSVIHADYRSRNANF